MVWHSTGKLLGYTLSTGGRASVAGFVYLDYLLRVGGDLYRTIPSTILGCRAWDNYFDLPLSKALASRSMPRRG